MCYVTYYVFRHQVKLREKYSQIYQSRGLCNCMPCARTSLLSTFTSTTRRLNQYALSKLKYLPGIIVSLSIAHYPHIYAPSPTQYSTSPCVSKCVAMRRVLWPKRWPISDNASNFHQQCQCWCSERKNYTSSFIKRYVPLPLYLLVINIDVAGSDLLLELCWVFVPQLGSFAVQRRCTTQN